MFPKYLYEIIVMTTAQSPNIGTDTIYNFTKFRSELFNLSNFRGPKVGESAIDFSATTLDGHQVHLSYFRGKVFVLEKGSITCPQFVRRAGGCHIPALDIRKAISGPNYL